jgi:hypothetical protein
MGYEDVVALFPVGDKPEGAPQVQQKTSCAHADDAEVGASRGVFQHAGTLRAALPLERAARAQCQHCAMLGTIDAKYQNEGPSHMSLGVRCRSQQPRQLRWRHALPSCWTPG